MTDRLWTESAATHLENVLVCLHMFTIEFEGPKKKTGQS